MFWPGMVLNQGQLSIVVSDWEPYLGSTFPSFLCGKLSLFVGTIALSFTVVFVVFIVLFGVILNKKGICTFITLHLGPVLSTAVTDNSQTVQYAKNSPEVGGASRARRVGKRDRQSSDCMLAV